MATCQCLNPSEYPNTFTFMVHPGNERKILETLKWLGRLGHKNYMYADTHNYYIFWRP